MKQKLRMNLSIQTIGNWTGCPTQTDQWNCGMFIIMYMYTLVKNSFVDATSFSASEMPNYRLNLAEAIKRGTL